MTASPVRSGLPDPELPSLPLVLELARAELSGQRTRFDGLDTKAGLIVGFPGLLMTTSTGLPIAPQIVAAVLASGSATAALLAVFPRRFPVLEVGRVADYMAAPLDRTRRTVVDTTVEMVRQATTVFRRKARYLAAAVSLLLATTVTVGTGVIVEAAHR